MLFSKKKSQITGLDIGSGSIKAAVVVETKKGQMLKKFGAIDVAPGIFEEGVIKDHPAAAELIRQLFKEQDIKDNNVALSIGGFSVIVKKINVQTMSEEQLQETIQFEAEQYIPYDISDVNLDFQILGENENNPNQMNVLLVAAKKDMVNDYVSLCELAGLNPVLMDIDAFALQNIFELNYPDNQDSVALIDIGAGKTSLNILKDNASVFMRDVSLGCIQINQKIASMIDCSLEEAEKIKLGTGHNERIAADDLNGIILSVVEDWCAEIRRALDFFYSTYPEDPIKKIMLSGGGANITEFREMLAHETSVEVDTIDPFRSFIVDEGRLDRAFLESVAPQAAICMGLSIRKVGDK
jgi:type IV pilus assembly protein PilM